VVDVTHRAHVDVGLRTLELLLGHFWLAFRDCYCVSWWIAG
jgi:hypothetical protein